MTDLVCDAPLHVTRVLRHQDPHAFWPRDLRVWRQFWFQFVLNRSASGSSNVEASVKDIHPSWASCSSVLMSARFVLTRCIRLLSRTLFTNSLSCSAVDVDDAFSSAHSRADSLFKLRAILELVVRGLVTHKTHVIALGRVYAEISARARSCFRSLG